VYQKKTEAILSKVLEKKSIMTKPTMCKKEKAPDIDSLQKGEEILMQSSQEAAKSCVGFFPSQENRPMLTEPGG